MTLISKYEELASAAREAAVAMSGTDNSNPPPIKTTPTETPPIKTLGSYQVEYFNNNLMKMVKETFNNFEDAAAFAE
jgi:hypothetical protein